MNSVTPRATDFRLRLLINVLRGVGKSAQRLVWSKADHRSPFLASPPSLTVACTLRGACLGRAPLRSRVRARHAAAAAAVRAALREQLEPQRARDRCGLDQAHRHAIAQAVGLAAAIADQRVAVFVIAEIFLRRWCAPE